MQRVIRGFGLHLKLFASIWAVCNLFQPAAAGAVQPVAEQPADGDGLGLESALTAGRPEWLPAELATPGWIVPGPEPAELPGPPPAPPALPQKSAAPTKAQESAKANPNKWDVRLGGHVQLDYVSWLSADEQITGSPGPSDFFEFRRLRLVADGTGYETCDFRLQMTLEPDTVGETPGVTSPDVKDAYFSMNEIPGVGRFRIGNFFVPFSLEQVTNDTNNIFLERSIPSQGVFSPDREVGVALYNCTEDERLGWATGAFFDSISEGLKERIDDNQGARFSGRVTWLPYYDECSEGRRLIHLGAGVLHTLDQDHRVRFRARPQIHEGPRLIDSGVIAADQYTTGNLEFAAVMGPVTVQSEAFLATVRQTNGVS
ncbi:MAG: Porin precursor, partial [Planctomycetota bacterium]